MAAADDIDRKETEDGDDSNTDGDDCDNENCSHVKQHSDVRLTNSYAAS